MIDDYPDEHPTAEDNAKKGLRNRYPHQQDWDAYKKKNPLSVRMPMSPSEDLRPCEYSSETVDGLPVSVIATQMRALIPHSKWNTFINWINCNPRYQAQFVSHETARVRLIIEFHRAYCLPLP